MSDKQFVQNNFTKIELFTETSRIYQNIFNIYISTNKYLSVINNNGLSVIRF